jgi:hypothetical protein
MGRGLGFVLLIISGISVYFRGQLPDYALWIGFIFFVIGLVMILFSRPKQPQPFR